MHSLLSLNVAATEIPIAELGQYGIAGVIGSIFLWFGWNVYKRERDRADKNEAEIKRLNEVIQEKYVPSLEAAASALSESNVLLAQLRDPPPRRRS